MFRAEVGGSPTGDDATGATRSRVGEDADFGRCSEAFVRGGEGEAVVVVIRSRLGVCADLGRRGDDVGRAGEEGVAVLQAGEVVATCRGG